MKPLNKRIATLEMPDRFKRLPISDEGYPIPYFVGWVDGKPDFRLADPEKMAICYRHRRCWLCGEQLGKFMAFVLGPMCAVNRTAPSRHRITTARSMPAWPVRFLLSRGCGATKRTSPRMRRCRNHAEAESWLQLDLGDALILGAARRSRRAVHHRQAGACGVLCRGPQGHARGNHAFDHHGPAVAARAGRAGRS